MPSHQQRSEYLTLIGIFLLLLLSADMGFMFIHLIHKFSTTFLESSLYALETDRGYAEIFQYVKIYWIIIMLAALWQRTRESVYVTWMLLFTYLLVDDAFQIHELGGIAIAEQLNYVSALGLRAKDFGELTISGTFGLTFLLLIFTMYLRSSLVAKNISKDLTLLFGTVVFFGIFVDMLHTWVGGGYIGEMFGVAEDGGEMLAMSVVCWYVLNLVERRGNVSKSLWQVAKSALISTRNRRMESVSQVVESSNIYT